MLKVGDMVTDIEFEDEPPGLRDDGKVEVVLERYGDDRQMVTSTVVCSQ